MIPSRARPPRTTSRRPVPRPRDSVVVRLEESSLRSGIGDLRWHLDDMLADGPSTLVIDVSGIERLSSTTIAALLWAKRHCLSRRVRVVVGDPTDHTLELLRRTGLYGVLEIEQSTDTEETEA